MGRISLLLAALAGWFGLAYADIEKIATTCDRGICFHWWPKLPEIEGWHHERDQSVSYGFNAQAPNGSTFANAESVIYAKAPYKPRMPDIKSIAELVSDDRQKFLSETSDLEIAEVDPIVTADGQSLRSFTFFSKSKGLWERVSYGEEGDFYLVFVLSSRTKEGLERAFGDYKRFINQYKKTPNQMSRKQIDHNRSAVEPVR